VRSTCKVSEHSLDIVRFHCLRDTSDGVFELTVGQVSISVDSLLVGLRRILVEGDDLGKFLFKDGLSVSVFS
jgi:hypothetical protein